MTNIALFGAGGNMGTRITNTLKSDAGLRLLPVEPDPQRQARMRDRGLRPVSKEEAVQQAEVAILAVPDNRIGRAATEIVPLLKKGAMVVCLDPAAPHAGKLPARPDISYFVTHPSHPPIFNDETDPEARRDFFGGGKAKQTIVCALMQGPEEDYARGEALARKIWQPVLRSHRVTVEQMAILEPVLSETVAATCLTVVREAMDEAIRRGVPAAAARDFLMGHLNIELALLFNEIEWQFSAGAKKAIEDAKPMLFRPDWKKVFEPEQLKESVHRITAEPA